MVQETMSSYAVAHLDEIDELTDGRCPYRPVRHHFGITAFGVNAFTGHQAGDRILNEHDEADPDSQEELYLVIDGRAEFHVDGELLDAPAGTFVSVGPGTRRTAFATEGGTTILALGGTPGQTYQPHGWEVWGPLRPLYDAGRYEEAAERGAELLAGDPPYAELYYNVACCECLAGRTVDALAHLRRAIELSELTRDYARTDSDFDRVRDEPEFEALVRQ
jgi:tetratricopeptide (TPR) repeat protein